MMDASVVICAYTLDRWDELNDAVASARAQSLRPREIILSIDGNPSLYRRARREISGATVVLNNRAPGLSGARMTGAGYATAPIIAFLDDDAVADANWLRELVRAYRDRRVLGAGGFIEPMWMSPRPPWFPGEFNWVVGCTYDGMRVRGDAVRNVLGANMSVRADVLRNAGGFTTALGRRVKSRRSSAVADSCEETEFCIRAARLHPGGYWAYRPTARVRHKIPQGRTTWAYFVRRCRMEGAAKAVLAGLAGSRDGLASERHYLTRVLSRAVLHELAGAVRGRPGSLRRAAAIAAGVSITAGAYLRARLAMAKEAWSRPSGAAGGAALLNEPDLAPAASQRSEPWPGRLSRGRR
jgi:glucosyl-dolichyl phosphate glucuronosyltransferase